MRPACGAQPGPVPAVKIIIASDIFGINDHLHDLSSQIEVGQLTTELVSPYTTSQANWFDEGSAYQAFQQAGGVPAYTKKLLQLNISSQDVVLGFSAGAAALWKCLADQQLSCVHMLGFYPSQIRHYLNPIPSCAVTLVFPAQEPHFDVKATIKTLSKAPNIRCIQTHHKHGFMNPASTNHVAQAAEAYKNWLIDVLTARV